MSLKVNVFIDLFLDLDNHEVGFDLSFFVVVMLEMDLCFDETFFYIHEKTQSRVSEVDATGV